MIKHIEYSPTGVCSRKIDIDVEDGIIKKVVYTGGCSGNTQGVASLLVGMSGEEAISRLDGIHCGFRPTSCPDQLARALKKHFQ
ncbi:MAG: TIGR03905 family TSCPD domain-containing protein [Clostridia bacterium]|nr:TIGR03905 family TSCPD domain-containing protein [Clostridia bacterium]